MVFGTLYVIGLLLVLCAFFGNTTQEPLPDTIGRIIVFLAGIGLFVLAQLIG